MNEMRIYSIKFRASQIRQNMQRSMQKIKYQRLIEGFYYYLNETEVGDRTKGWMMVAHD